MKHFINVISTTILAAVLTLTVGCTKKSDTPATPDASAQSSKVRVALILDKGGKDDKSFNTAAWEGALKAKKDFDIELKDICLLYTSDAADE